MNRMSIRTKLLLAFGLITALEVIFSVVASRARAGRT
jgi:hypothetical protein